MSDRNEKRDLVLAFCRARLSELGEDRSLRLEALAGPMASKGKRVALVRLPEGDDEFLRAVGALLAPAPVGAPMSAPKGRLSRRFANLEIG